MTSGGRHNYLIEGLRRLGSVAIFLLQLLAASVAARIILPPPEACIVSMLTPRLAASPTAAATVLGIS